MNRNKLRLALHIFLTFFRMGCFTFGSGWSILAQLEQEYVDKRKLLTKEDLLELTTVGKSIPGVMITNVSMLAGYQLAGVAGGFAAVIGLTLPAIFILTLVTWGYDAIKSNTWFAAAMRGIGGAVVAIIASAAWSLGSEALRDWVSIAICALTFALCVFTPISKVVLVGIGVAAALIWFGLRTLRARKGGAEK